MEMREWVINEELWVKLSLPVRRPI